MARKLAPAAAIAAFGCLLFCSAASAQLSASNVSTPADGSRLISPPNVTISGTTTGLGSGDHVKIICTWPGDSTTITDNAAVQSDGSFSYTGSIANAAGTPCVLRAVDASTSVPDDLTPFTGPRVLVDRNDPFTVGGGPNDGMLVDYDVISNHFDGMLEFFSLGDCGLDFSYVFDPATLEESPELFDCNGWLPKQFGPIVDRTSLQVDGVNAYVPASAEEVNLNAVHFPALTYTRTVDADGLVTIVEHDPVVRCTGGSDPNPWPANPSSCPDFESAGLSVEVTIQQLSSRMARFTHRFVSTDGRSHEIDALYSNWTGSENHNGGIWFPWASSGFRGYGIGDTVPAAPAGPGSIFHLEDLSLPDGEIDNPVGSTTFSSPPDGGAKFVDATTEGQNQFWLQYRRTVPAGGSMLIGFTFADGLVRSDVESMARAAEAFYRPSVTITSPADGSSGNQASVTVTGTTSDASGNPSVSVNGVAATVASSGSWSATMPLHAGSNTLIATATNVWGVTAATSRTVTYNPPAQPTLPGLPAFKGASFSGSTFRLDSHGNLVLSILCPASAVVACNPSSVEVDSVGKILLRAAAHKRKKARRVRFGHKSFTALSGRTVRVKVRLSKAALRYIKRHKRLKANVIVSETDAAKRTAKTTKRISIRPAKKKRRR